MLNDAKEAAGEAANTIIGTAIHAKDVAVEKVQEIGHTVNSNLILRFHFNLYRYYYSGC
jgi:hypothetical protein